ncbi:hypothetical protein EVAR_88639_1 [Eumeta japonica]|uniref:Uncharacterized protein n=1 Tax=Eumeta variegata TaxID=151549 RepID=A0A4C1X1Q1_EUMVA|nr:hypothetical protein EVAR_88639_1 [Eumeta japonica]
MGAPPNRRKAPGRGWRRTLQADGRPSNERCTRIDEYEYIEKRAHRPSGFRDRNSKPLPPRSEMKKIPAKAMKSKEVVAAGGEHDIPTCEILEPAVLQPRSVHHRQPSNSVGPVMMPDKRTRDQLSPSHIPEPKKYVTDLKPAHTIPNTPQSPLPVRRSGVYSILRQRGRGIRLHVLRLHMQPWRRRKIPSQHSPPHYIQSRTNIVCNSGVGTNATIPPNI